MTVMSTTDIETASIDIVIIIQGILTRTAKGATIINAANMSTGTRTNMSEARHQARPTTLERNKRNLKLMEIRPRNPHAMLG